MAKIITKEKETEKELIIFTNKEFGEVRALIIDDEPWFVGKDVVEKLGYKNISDALKKHVDEDDKLQIAKRDLQNQSDIGTKGAVLINESGFYGLVLSSGLDSAKRFKKWVTGEVLPSIRKHGAYINDNPQEVDQDYVKFARGTVRDTFMNCPIEKINSLFDECMKFYSKNKLSYYTEKGLQRSDRKFRSDKKLTYTESKMEMIKTIKETLKERATNLIGSGSVGCTVDISFSINRIIEEEKKLKMKHDRALLGGMGRVLKKKERELQELEQYRPIKLEDMILIDNYAISKNDLQMAVTDFRTGKPRLANTNEYNGWKYYFKNAMDEANVREIFSDIDWSKPVEISYGVTCHQNNDISNFIEALQDVVQEYFGCDDKNFYVGSQIRVGIEPDKMKRKTWIYFRNIEEIDLGDVM